jgi:hypothetical protein
MPVHIRSITHGDLRLTFISGGEIVDNQVAATGEEAARIGIMMLASRDALQAGDRLDVRLADEDRVTTLVPGPGGGR